jgi:type II secretory pathway pseudopilin PulG
MTFPTQSSSRARAARKNGQEGFTLAALIVILTVMAIIVAYTVPQQWSMVMQREREKQTIFLMKQYARGIREFQKKHNSLPVSMDQLLEAKDPRYLRNGGKWPCPLTGREDDWILVPPNAVTAAQDGSNPATRGTNPATPADRYAERRQNRGRGRGGSSARGGGGGPQLRPPSQLNPENSPADYVGQFVGVRPNAKGKAFIALNGAEDYSQWVYTVTDLENELALQMMALNPPPASGLPP